MTKPVTPRHAPDKMTRAYNQTMAQAAAIHRAPMSPIEEIEARFNRAGDELAAKTGYANG